MEICNKQRGTFVALITASFICFQQRVESITLLVGRDEDSLKEVDQVGNKKGNQVSKIIVALTYQFPLPFHCKRQSVT